jgi:hypothetical protein
MKNTGFPSARNEKSFFTEGSCIKYSKYTQAELKRACEIYT